MANVVVPLVFLGVAIIVALMMPLFTNMGVPSGDALTIIETTFSIIRNETVATHNITSDSEQDTMYIIGGSGIGVSTFFNNDTIRVEYTGAVGGGEANDGTNVGGQTGQVFRDKTGTTLNFKTISGGDGITITNNANDIDIGVTQFDDLTSIFSTGVLEGGVLSTGAGANQYSISDGNGLIVNSTGFKQSVSWTGKSNIVPTNLATNLISFVSIDSGGNVVEQTAKFTTDDCRLRICLGVVVHVDNVNVDTVNNEQVAAYNVRSQLFDLAQSIGFFNVEGNVFSANGPNLTLDKSQGKIFAQGSNYDIDWEDPNVKTLGALTGLTFQYRFSDGTNGVTGTNIDPNNLDDGAGGTTAVDNNKWSVQRIYSFVSNNVKIQRGVEDFATSSDAINSITLENYITEPSIKANGILRGWLAVQQGATALNGNQAVFIEAPKFGEGGGAAGSGATVFDENLTLDVQKGSVGTINAGEAVRITGYDATDGVPEVELADSTSAATMPAIGIASTSITDTVTGNVIISGLLSNQDTSSWTAGTQLYVSETAGALTSTKPTGTADIQKVGIVTRQDASVGIIEVIGAGRSNDIPNLATHGMDLNSNTFTNGVLTSMDLSSATNTFPNLEQLNNVTSTGCAVGEILKVSGTTWQCAADESGGGSAHNILSATHTDAATNTVVRGDLITGQTASPQWDRLALGGATTFLGSDGTDVVWESIAKADLPSTVVHTDQANTYTDGNLQTFTDDDFRITDNVGGQFYTFSTGDISANRVVNLPVITTGDTFTMNTATQTLTTKTITLGSNTISGSTAEFNTANTDGTFVTIENTHTYNDGIKQTFNPSATTSGLNVGGHTAEPSVPADGDLFLDTTANQMKARINGAWVNLGASGGSNALLDGSAHTDTVAQAVTRGSLIYGDATPNWNELVIGGSATFLRSDGTDPAWTAIADTDLPANVVLDDETNTYGDGLKQTFNPDATNAGLNVGGHTAEPSTPVDGDLFLDTTANQMKARINGAWVNLGASGGSNALLDGSAHTDTVAQAVTRGSLIYGDATPNWNELVVGGANTVLKADGTDVAWGSLVKADLPATVVHTDQANTYTDANMQTFTDDDFRITDNVGGQFYTFSTGDISADRVVSLPVITTGDTFTMNTATQTLTTKTITLGSNTISGSTAEFNTANTDGTFVTIENTHTYSDGIKQTFNPDATNAGLNVGGHTAEPSTPADGDLFLDTTANQMKARINGAWVNLGASGGSNALLDGSAHTDTVAQAVTRGSLIYGDATPNWNELVVGGANTVLKADGTDVAWGSLVKADLPATVVHTDQANTYTVGTQDFGSLTIQGFDLDCDGTGNSCTNVDTADIIGVAEPKTATFTCGSAQPQVTATPPKATIDGSNMDYVVCDYSDGVTERLVWTYEVPDNMETTGNVDVTVHFTTTGTAGVCWDVAFNSVANDEVLDSAFGTLNGGCDSATVTGDLETASITGITQANHGIAGGDLLFIKLERDFADATDTNTADARFIAMEIEWN